MNLTMEELAWYRHRCEDCGKEYKSTGRKSICPECKSEHVTSMLK